VLRVFLFSHVPHLVLINLLLRTPPHFGHSLWSAIFSARHRVVCLAIYHSPYALDCAYGSFRVWDLSVSHNQRLTVLLPQGAESCVLPSYTFRRGHPFAIPRCLTPVERHQETRRVARLSIPSRSAPRAYSHRLVRLDILKTSYDGTAQCMATVLSATLPPGQRYE
jgi:hypothetical protein